MSFNICSLSGNIVEVPVISKKTGHVYEKRLIEKHIDATGQCPMTGSEMTKDDLIDIKTTKSLKPRTAQTTTIPNIISNLQSEWDNLMLETFNLRKQLDQTRQELAHSLYQYDASCRVICRLIKERDEAKNTLANFRDEAENLENYEESHNGEEFENMGIYKELIERMNELFSKLSSDRKIKTIPPNIVNFSEFNNFKVKNTFPLHSTVKGNITSMDINIDLDVILTGGNDGKGILFDVKKEKVIAEIDYHVKRINSVQLFPSNDINGILLCSSDNTASFWLQGEEEDSKFQERYIIRSHKLPVTSGSFHPLKEYCLVGSRDSNWSFHNLVKGVCLQKTLSNKPIESVKIHPDGLIFGTGESDGCVKIWDISSQQNVAVFECHKSDVSKISFSQNGFYLATCSRSENIIKIWDLRKPKNIKTIELEGWKSISDVEFDFSGLYLGIAGTHSAVCSVKNWELTNLNVEKEELSQIRFGKDSKYIAIGSQNDRFLSIIA